MAAPLFVIILFGGFTLGYNNAFVSVFLRMAPTGIVFDFETPRILLLLFKLFLIH